MKNYNPAYALQLEAEEKVAVLRTVEIFTRRKGNADVAAFEALMNRPTGAQTLPGDELPDGYVRKPLVRKIATS
jgi:hypothetical protein